MRYTIDEARFALASVSRVEVISIDHVESTQRPRAGCCGLLPPYAASALPPAAG